MLWEAGCCDDIWDTYFDAGCPEIEGGDQAWIENCMFNPDILQDEFPTDFISYKVHCNNTLLHKPKVVVFHGEPRPHNAGGWVDHVWKIGGGTALELMNIGNTANDQLVKNIDHAMSLGLETLKQVPAHDGVALFVGGGPSVNKDIDEIRERQKHGQKVFALNGSWAWLEKNGLCPDYHVLLDARPENADFILDDSVPMYYASQCSKDVFAHARNPVLWHHLNAQQILPNETLFVAGGSSVGLNALSIAYILGYREMHLFGYDSSYEAEQGHAYPQALNDKDRTISVTCGGRDFITAPWMVTQVEEFKILAPIMLSLGCVLCVHGDGLLPHTAKILSRPPESEDGIMKIGDTWWPCYDNECRLSIDRQLRDIQEILPFVKNKGVCIQAGGNVGMWPKEFARHFDLVYTFEPNPLNFKCLMRNCEESNIAKVEAALGDKDGNAAIQEVENNCGACFIKDGNEFPVMTIDGLELDACDLIQLDIEGYELNALRGAAETIVKLKPVIVVEDKGLSERYGSKEGDITKYLSTFGYTIAKHINRDIVFTC
jgi:FkbM family methyltransferase